MPYATPATAHEVGTTYTEVVAPAENTAPDYDMWFKWTLPVQVSSIGFNVDADEGDPNYFPVLSAFTGPDPGTLTPYLLFDASGLVQLPPPAGTTLYLRVRNQIGLLPSSTCIVSGYRGADATAPAGSILIPDDTPGFPAMIVSSATGQNLQQRVDFPVGEQGDILSDGHILLQDGFGTSCWLYAPTLLARVEVLIDSAVIRTCRGVDAFIVVSKNVPPPTVSRVDADGTITLLATLSAGTVWSAAANNDLTILYYTIEVAGSALHRWDLVNDVALSDLVGVTAAPAYFITDLLVLADDSILASYTQTVLHEVDVRHYAPDGTLISSTGTLATLIPGGTQPRMDYAPATSDSFWLWTHHSPGLSRFRQIAVDAWTVLTTVESTEFEAGIDQSGGTGNSFGVSFSCPLIVTTVPISSQTTEIPPIIPPETPTETCAQTVRIRRLRRAPHLADEQLWKFYHFLQIDLETGVGLGVGPAEAPFVGDNPYVMLRWSDDGGHTWSREHWVSAGRMGQYRSRVVFRRLGRSRDRIYEVVVSDPVRWNLVAAYLDVTAGTS